MNITPSLKIKNCIALLLVAFLVFSATLAQTNSKNGWRITRDGTIRVLVIFAEIDFNDQMLNAGNSLWQQGSLPTYKDDWYDKTWTGTPQKEMTKFFYEMSMGEYTVLGDYLSDVITINVNNFLPSCTNFAGVLNVSCDSAKNLCGQSWYDDLIDHDLIMDAVIHQANTAGSLSTSANLAFSDFDKWDHPANEGEARSQTPNGNYDHVMVVVRNWKCQSAATARYHSFPQNLYGKSADTWAVYNTSTFDIRKHEYGHLLLGHNNFHACGGHDRAENSYYISTQGGWGIMGNAGSSLKTANAWERRRLGWLGPQKAEAISCGQGGNEEPTDLDALDLGDADTYTIRDFVTTGDAIRIKLPFIPGSEFQQWLWIENHQGISEFDEWDYRSCQNPFQKGLYMYVQVDKEVMEGTETFGGYADYLKPLAANGMFDVEVTSPYQYDCGIGNETNRIQVRGDANPLSGYSDFQQTDYDIGQDGHISWGDREANFVEGSISNPQALWAWRGHGRHAFHNGQNGKTKIGISTNPATASHTTLVSDNDTVELIPPNLQNNRTIYLNGVSVEITGYNSGSGAITVDVKFDDIHIENNTRWCGDNIYLPNLAGEYSTLSSAGWSLIIDGGKRLSFGRNQMPYRIDDPDANGLFNDPTTFRMESQADILVQEGGRIVVDEGSTMILGSGNQLKLDNATLEVINGSTLVLDPGSLLNVLGNGSVYIDETSTLEMNGGATIILQDDDSKLRIAGTIKLKNNAIFTFTGNGQIDLIGDFVNFDTESTVTWPLRGSGKDDVVLMLYGAHPVWNGGAVDFFNGKVVYWEDESNITIVGSPIVEVDNCRFTSEYFGTYLFEDLDALIIEDAQAEILNTDFDGFDISAITLKDYNGSSKIESCTFLETAYPIDIYDYTEVEIKQCTIENYLNAPPNNPTNPDNAGVRATNVTQVRLDLSEIKQAAYGVFLEAVGSFYMRGGLIDSCDMGIESYYSEVYLRSGATISNCNEWGVYSFAEDPLTSMVTLGDSGCANIIQNDVAIGGMGTLINVDAYIHATNAGTPSFVQFNRLDQNAHNFLEMCYDNASSYYVPTQLHAKGVYYASTPGSGDFEIIETSDFYVNNWSCGTTSMPIAVDYSQHSTCTPAGICDCYAGTPPGGNGSFGGVQHKRSESEWLDNAHYLHDEVRLTNQIVSSGFIDAQDHFLNTDDARTRAGFIPLASVGLVNIEGKWWAKSTKGKIFELDEESTHRIAVAKVLTKRGLDAYANEINIFEELENQIEGLADNPIVQIFPNPNNGQVECAISGLSQTFEYNLSTAIGVSTESGKLGVGQSTLDFKHLASGTYHLLIKDAETGKVIGKEILIIQK